MIAKTVRIRRIYGIARVVRIVTFILRMRRMGANAKS